MVLEPFEMVAWNCLRAFTPVGDYRYLLLVVDCAMRWCEGTPAAAADHEHVMILLSAICVQFGILRTCLSDKGMHSKGSIFDIWHLILG